MDIHSKCNVNSFANFGLIFIPCQKIRYMQIETNLNQENIKLLQRSTLSVSLSLITTITVAWRVKIILKGPSFSTLFEISTCSLTEDIQVKKTRRMNVFVKIKGWYFCNRFRILLLPSEVLTSQEAFTFEKLCWKNTKQNMSSLFIEALYFLLECC